MFIVALAIGFVIGTASATLGFVLWAMLKFPRL